MIGKRAALAGLMAIAAFAPAHADVTISSATTANMDCSGGTCVPTATNAVLNTTDLENDLSQFGNVRVMTTGSGVEANNIVVKAAFSSPDSTSLTLEAHKAITADAAVSIGAGTAELELQSDTLAASDTLSFGRKGHVTFGNLSDIFGINGGIFTLVGSVQGLASAVAANPSGAYALANNYDAAGDGTYANAPVTTTFPGTFNGLGNAISQLSIQSTQNGNVGLFAEVGQTATVTSIRLESVNVQASYSHHCELQTGALAGWNLGSITNSSASGQVAATGRCDVFVGGLVGRNGGQVMDSSTTTDVNVGGGAGGGLVGYNSGGVVSSSYSSGTISKRTDADGAVGGLVGQNTSATITTSYATGPVSAKFGAWVGGFVGVVSLSGNTITDSYSTGQVTCGAECEIGGFAGGISGTVNDTYWDTTTSGTDQGTGGGNHSGITGLTTQQFQSGLPTGFDPKVWAEDPNINNGLPYLIANPPPK